MKTKSAIATLLVLPLVALGASTIDSANKYAYGANAGWMDWRGDTNHGVRMPVNLITRAND